MNIDIFLKNQCWIRRAEKEKRSISKEAVQGTNTSKDWDLLMTRFHFICVVRMICSILLEMSVNRIFGECQLQFHSDNLLRFM